MTDLPRKPNLAKEKTPMKELELNVRVRSFDEIELGYTLDQAQEEASRCLRCPKEPCVTGCPINNHIPQFIAAIEAGDILDAYQIIRQRSNLPAVCSRVCSQEVQCEGNCTRGRNGEPVNIGALERFVCDYVVQNHTEAVFGDYLSGIEGENVSPDTLKGKTVAIVGSGAASLSAAQNLVTLGAKVTIYESEDYLGGVMVAGIPRFRLPKKHVRSIISSLEDKGVVFKTNRSIDTADKIKHLRSDFDAVIIANGATNPRLGGIAGESDSLVIPASELLLAVNHGDDDCKEFADIFSRIKGKRVAVLGGGNVAMDAAQVAVRLAAKSVQVIYRRSIEEMPARRDEIEISVEEGVKLELMQSPTHIVFSEDEPRRILGVNVQDVELGEPDETGRRFPVCKVGTDHIIECDEVITAIGSVPTNAYLAELDDDIADKTGLIVVDDSGRTNMPRVYAAGDAVTGPKTVVHALRGASDAVLAMVKDLA